MKELVQNVLVMTILITVLKGLIRNPKYEQYFQFFGGMVMILLFLTPVMTVWGKSGDWFEGLEEKLLQMDRGEVKQELAMAEGVFENILCREYEEAVSKEVQLFAREQGVELSDAGVTLKKNGESWEIAEINGVIQEKKQDSGDEDDGEELVEKVAIETVQLEKDKKYPGKEKSDMTKEDTSEEAEVLRQELCNHFVLGKEQVHVWK